MNTYVKKMREALGAFYEKALDHILTQIGTIFVCKAAGVKFLPFCLYFRQFSMLFALRRVPPFLPLWEY